MEPTGAGYSSMATTPRIARIDPDDRLKRRRSSRSRTAAVTTAMVYNRKHQVVAGTASRCLIPERRGYQQLRENFQGMLTFIKGSNGRENWISLSRYCCLHSTTTWRTPVKELPMAGRSLPPTIPKKNTLLEVNASQNDKDFIAAVNWKKQKSTSSRASSGSAGAVCP